MKLATETLAKKDGILIISTGYPRLPPLPPRFVSVFLLREDKFSSLDFKNLAILSSKFSFGLKLPFERKSFERLSVLPCLCGRWE